MSGVTRTVSLYGAVASSAALATPVSNYASLEFVGATATGRLLTEVADVLTTEASDAIATET